VGGVNINNERNIGTGVLLQSGLYIPAFRQRFSIISRQYIQSGSPKLNYV